jgi:hypothetical protein
MDGASAQDRGGGGNAATVDGYSANQIARAAYASAEEIAVPASGVVKAAGAQMRTPKGGWVIAFATGVAVYEGEPWELTYSLTLGSTCPTNPPATSYVHQLEAGEAAFSLNQGFESGTGTRYVSLCAWKTDGVVGAAAIDQVDLVLIHIAFDFDGLKP